MSAVDQLFAQGDGKLDLLALWRVVWRYKYLIVLSTALCGGIALYLALTAIPVYRAEVSITEVTNNNMGAGASLANQFGGLASLVGMNIGGGGSSRESQAILKSRRLVEDFVKRYDLRSVLFKKEAKPPTLWFTVRYVQNNVIAIREDKRSGLTMVEVNWTDPALAARWADDFVGLANETIRTRALNESKASIAYLDKQIAQTNVVEMQRVMYNLIESETKTLMLANAKAEYAFTIVDPAVIPEVRFSPRRTLMVLMGLALGGFLGLIGAFALNLVSLYRGKARQSP